LIARIAAALVGLACFAEGQTQIRIASLNLNKIAGPKALEQITRQPDLRLADILLLQELVDGEESRMPSAIAHELGLNVVYAPAYRLNARFDEGLAVLSRYPLSQMKVLPLAHNSLHFHTRVRIALAVTVDCPWGPMRVIDIHLDNRINSDAKQEQLAGIREETSRYTGPFIIGGDFNSGNFRWSSHLLPLPGIGRQRATIDREMARNGFATPLGAGPGTLHFLGLKLDWIYLRQLRALDSGVTLIPFSDHNSVWVTVANPDVAKPEAPGDTSERQ
jgi:endonuclease/exonuclease/phosphatase family metal-dependent hydrolase